MRLKKKKERNVDLFTAIVLWLAMLTLDYAEFAKNLLIRYSIKFSDITLRS
jgi:hypothetical protein